jgi:uncharacterized protein YdbL (DUF1318 family)
MGIHKRSTLAAALMLAAAGCTPKVAIEAPNEPIAINLNIKLDADVRFHLAEKAKTDIKEEPVFSVASAADSRGPGATRSIAPQSVPNALETIGERFDGYVVPRYASAPKSTTDIVARINAQRFALYEERAKEERAPVSAVGIIYAEEILKSAPKGTYFLDASGNWHRT